MGPSNTSLPGVFVVVDIVAVVVAGVDNIVGGS